ncbi:hypothetical protein ACFSM5_07880 [Lacibacterium aquatile]|uniref:Uncharacterized protein n=1 Tax=Lacibacterium aquatile TaxID=1168082 RepID=A0ABW5DPF2_9PROT
MISAIELALSIDPDGGYVVELVDQPVIGSDPILEGLRRHLPGGWSVLVDAADLNRFRLHVETDDQLLALIEALAALNAQWACALAAPRLHS